jgi:hypothetical protein
MIVIAMRSLFEDDPLAWLVQGPDDVKAYRARTKPYGAELLEDLSR